MILMVNMTMKKIMTYEGCNDADDDTGDEFETDNDGVELGQYVDEDDMDGNYADDVDNDGNDDAGANVLMAFEALVVLRVTGGAGGVGH